MLIFRTEMDGVSGTIRASSSDSSTWTVWGLDDGTSWLNGFPVRGRTNHPLLFDRQLKAKPCYDALVKLKQPKK